MQVKEWVLKILEKNRGKTISGESLAETIGVSRASVWKAIKSLRSQGYKIQGITNRGYCLLEENNLLSKEGIAAYLEYPENFQFYIYDTLDSTNTKAKQLAAEGCPANTVVIANQQTAGKGRLGRSFYSPPNVGLYLSYVLRIPFWAENAVLVTTAVSVAVSRAILKLTGQETEIKWVNDIYYRKKKICGILTEAISNFETGSIEAMVIGVGINLCTDSFPSEIQKTAGALLDSGETVSRNALVAAVVTELSSLEEMINNRSFLEDYRKRSMVIGKNISIVQQGGRQVRAIGIDEDGGLIVEDERGEEEVLRTGEISIRLTNPLESDSMK